MIAAWFIFHSFSEHVLRQSWHLKSKPAFWGFSKLQNQWKNMFLGNLDLCIKKYVFLKMMLSLMRNHYFWEVEGSEDTLKSIKIAYEKQPTKKKHPTPQNYRKWDVNWALGGRKRGGNGGEKLTCSTLRRPWAAIWPSWRPLGSFWWPIWSKCCHNNQQFCQNVCKVLKTTSQSHKNNISKS